MQNACGWGDAEETAVWFVAVFVAGSCKYSLFAERIAVNTNCCACDVHDAWERGDCKKRFRKALLYPAELRGLVNNRLVLGTFVSLAILWFRLILGLVARFVAILLRIYNIP